MMAAAGGHTQTVDVLVSEGHADPNFARYDGWTAMMAAACNGHCSTIAILREHGAGPSINRGRGIHLSLIRFNRRQGILLLFAPVCRIGWSSLLDPLRFAPRVVACWPSDENWLVCAHAHPAACRVMGLGFGVQGFGCSRASRALSVFVFALSVSSWRGLRTELRNSIQNQ